MGITPRRRRRRAKKITAMVENCEIEERGRKRDGKLEQRRGQRGGEAAEWCNGAKRVTRRRRRRENSSVGNNERHTPKATAEEHSKLERVSVRVRERGRRATAKMRIRLSFQFQPRATIGRAVPSLSLSLSRIFLSPLPSFLPSSSLPSFVRAAVSVRI